MHRDRFGFDLTTNIRVFPDREHPIRIDLPLDFSIDKKLFLKRNRAFDFDIPRQSAFPSGGRIFYNRHRFLISVFTFRLILAGDLSPVAVAQREGVCSPTSVESILEGFPR